MSAPTSSTAGNPSIPTSRFLLLTPRLLLVPSPLILEYHLDSYLSFYASLHASANFCTTAFGDKFLPRTWQLEDARRIIKLEVDREWATRGIGDFGVALLDANEEWRDTGASAWRVGADGGVDLCVVEGEAFESLMEQDVLSTVLWVGYAGIRYAAYSVPPRPAPLPAWTALVELRYGIRESQWRKGFGSEAARAVMRFGERERGVRRHVAETERANFRSGGVLRKLGFVETTTVDGEGNGIAGEWWRDGSVREWEVWVGTGRGVLRSC